LIRIGVIPGDGVGHEVTTEACRVLEAVARSEALSLEFEHFDLGADRWLRDGVGLPQGDFERLRDECDAILLGAVGDPRVPDNAHAREILLGLRTRLDLYVNLRPCRFFVPAHSPLRNPPEQGARIEIVRENTEGPYVNIGGGMGQGTDREVAVQESVHTVRGVSRIIRYAFERASARGVDRVTLVDKANALPAEGALWRRVFSEIASEYPSTETRALYVDVAAMELVSRPAAHGVIVTSNLFGDILSDLSAVVTGGIGLAPSANIHPGRHGLFEPVHGSAPDIAGTGRANPIGAILSAALLLEAAGEDSAARRVETAVEAALVDGPTTPDIGGTATTAECGAWIAARVEG